jgi:hypothetical protein
MLSVTGQTVEATLEQRLLPPCPSRRGDLAWHAAGSDTAELLLIALGVDRKEARALASTPLPPLPKPV